MKTNKWKALFVLAAIVTMATVINCGGGGGSSPTPQTGFKAKGEDWYLAFSGYQFLSGASIQGDWVSNNGSTTGSSTHFEGFTNSGYMNVSDGKVPAKWNIFVPGACLTHLDTRLRDVTVGSSQQDRCVVAFQFLTADPSSVDLYSPPSTVSFEGGGFDSTYGMPVIEFYDQYSGELIATTTAYSVAGNGSTTVCYTPGLYGVYSGAYNVVVSNKNADGSNSIVGVAAFSACCIDPPPPDPPPDPPPCNDGPCLIQ